MSYESVARVAYYCMEFGLDERFPIYSGGLGVLAGDFLRAARALELPVVGVGLLYGEGYTRQVLGSDGVPLDQPMVVDRSFCTREAATVSVLLQQTCLGYDTVERWADICLS